MKKSTNKMISFGGLGFTILALLNLIFTILIKHYPNDDKIISFAEIFCRDVDFYVYYIIIWNLVIIYKEIEDIKKKINEDVK